MARPKTGKVRVKLHLSVHPTTVEYLERVAEEDQKPMSRIVEGLILDMKAEREATRDKMQE